METGPSDRLERLCSVFLGARLEIHRDLLRQGLNKEERSVYEDRLCEWWYRFAKRTGNLQRSPEGMKEDLLFCASTYAADFKEWMRSEPKIDLPLEDESKDAGKDRRGLKLVNPQGAENGESANGDGERS